LSIKTKKAHIPLVSHNNNVIQPAPNVIHFVISDILIFSDMYVMTSLISTKPNNNTNGPDKKFILTAMVSADNHHHPNIDPILNQKAINECRKNGIVLAVPILPRINPKFSAITFGTYIYA